MGKDAGHGERVDRKYTRPSELAIKENGGGGVDVSAEPLAGIGTADLPPSPSCGGLMGFGGTSLSAPQQAV